MSTATAPMEIGTVTLTVRDLPRSADFYARALGLETLHADGTEAVMGAGNRALVRLIADPAARQRSPREAASSIPRSCCPTARRWGLGSTTPSTRACPSKVPPTTRSAKRSTSPIPKATGSKSTWTVPAISGRNPTAPST